MNEESVLVMTHGIAVENTSVVSDEGHHGSWSNLSDVLAKRGHIASDRMVRHMPAGATAARNESADDVSHMIHQETLRLHGDVVLVDGDIDIRKFNLGICERYGKAIQCSVDFMVVSYRGQHHMFDPNTGLCLESPGGIMRGWRIHPHELGRFLWRDPDESRCVAGPNGERLTVYKVVVYGKWYATWMVGSTEWRGRRGEGLAEYDHRPTDAEVVSACVAWTKKNADAAKPATKPPVIEPERVATASDGTNLRLRRVPNRDGWYIHWDHDGRGYSGPWRDGGLDILECCPTDAEAISVYDAWLVRKRRAAEPREPRYIKAPDGNIVEISKAHGIWSLSWSKKKGKLIDTSANVHSGIWEDEPSTEKAIAVYERWRQDDTEMRSHPGVRNIVAGDGRTISVWRVRDGYSGWLWTWGWSVDADRYHHRAGPRLATCPTDADVLADYAAWTVRRNAGGTA